MQCIKRFWKHGVTLCAVIAILLCAVPFFSQTKLGPQSVLASEKEEKVYPVVTGVSAMRLFENRLKVQGNLEAKHYALVPAQVGGVIEEYFVDEGDVVVAGETKICQIDSLKLRKAVDVRRQELAVARLATQEKRALLERTQLEVEKAKLDYSRFERLRKDGAVSADAYERQDTYYKQMQASLKHARTLVDLSSEQEQQAKAAMAISEKDLVDSLVISPVSGMVSIRFHKPGEMAESGKPVIRIDDNSTMEVSAFLPEQYYDKVHCGETKMRVYAAGAE